MRMFPPYMDKDPTRYPWVPLVHIGYIASTKEKGYDKPQELLFPVEIEESNERHRLNVEFFGSVERNITGRFYRKYEGGTSR